MTDLAALDALILALAVYRGTRLVTTDTFPPLAWARNKILARWPADDTRLDESEVVTHTDEANDSTGVATTTSGVALVHITQPGNEGWWPVKGHWFGELVTCGDCASVWVAGVVVGSWVWWEWSRWVWLVLAASAVTGLILRRFE